MRTLLFLFLSLLLFVPSSVYAEDTSKKATDTTSKKTDTKTSNNETKKKVSKSSTPKGFVPPKLKQFIKAPYPKVELKKRKNVSVILQLIVDKKGQVAKVTILQSAGKAFDDAAMKAAKQFQFVPATYKGKPVPVRINYRYAFFCEDCEGTDKSSCQTSTAHLPTHKSTCCATYDGQKKGRCSRPQQRPCCMATFSNEGRGSRSMVRRCFSSDNASKSR